MRLVFLQLCIIIDPNKSSHRCRKKMSKMQSIFSRNYCAYMQKSKKKEMRFSICTNISEQEGKNCSRWVFLNDHNPKPISVKNRMVEQLETSLGLVSGLPLEQAQNWGKRSRRKRTRLEREREWEIIIAHNVFETTHENHSCNDNSIRNTNNNNDDENEKFSQRHLILEL